jgi:hypothetical protein
MHTYTPTSTPSLNVLLYKCSPGTRGFYKVLAWRSSSQIKMRSRGREGSIPFYGAVVPPLIEAPVLLSKKAWERTQRSCHRKERDKLTWFMAVECWSRGVVGPDGIVFCFDLIYCNNSALKNGIANSQATDILLNLSHLVNHRIWCQDVCKVLLFHPQNSRELPLAWNSTMGLFHFPQAWDGRVVNLGFRFMLSCFFARLWWGMNMGQHFCLCTNIGNGSCAIALLWRVWMSLVPHWNGENPTFTFLLRCVSVICFLQNLKQWVCFVVLIPLKPIQRDLYHHKSCIWTATDIFQVACEL